jgi:hypothetical protein
MDEKDFLCEQWKMAAELHRHEDNLLWQRFSYFVTLTGILASGLAILLTADEGKSEIIKDYRYLFLAAVSFFGASISLAFTFIFRRAYLYHILRICQAEQAEIRLEKLLDDKTPPSEKEEISSSQFFVYEEGLASRLLSKLRDGEGCAELRLEKKWLELRKENRSPKSDDNKKGWFKRQIWRIKHFFFRQRRYFWHFARPVTNDIIFGLSLLMTIAWTVACVFGLIEQFE